MGKKKKIGIGAIIGVGASREKELLGAGFDTVEKIARATPERIGAKCNIAEDTAEKIIEDAKRLANPKTTVELERTIERMNNQIDSLYDWVQKNEDQISNIQRTMIANAQIDRDHPFYIAGPFKSTEPIKDCICCGKAISPDSLIYYVYKLNKERKVVDRPAHYDCINVPWGKIINIEYDLD